SSLFALFSLPFVPREIVSLLFLTCFVYHRGVYKEERRRGNKRNAQTVHSICMLTCKINKSWHGEDYFSCSIFLFGSRTLFERVKEDSRWIHVRILNRERGRSELPRFMCVRCTLPSDRMGHPSLAKHIIFLFSLFPLSIRPFLTFL